MITRNQHSRDALARAEADRASALKKARQDELDLADRIALEIQKKPHYRDD